MTTSTGQLGDATPSATVASTDKITTTNVAGSLQTTAVSLLTSYLKTLWQNTSGNFAGLTQFKLNLVNDAGTFTSTLANTATAVRAWTLKDYDCTFAGLVSDFLIMKSTANSGVKVDEASPAYAWADLKGTYIVDSSGTAAPTLETMATGITRLGFNVSDICRTEFHIEHRDVAGGVKYLHPHVMLATGATAATTNLVLSHVVRHSYGSIGTGETRGTSPAPITVTQTITVAEVNTIGSGNNKAFDIEFANSGGTGGKLNSTNFLPDDLIDVTTTVTSIPTITGGTSVKVSLTPIDIHREVRDMSGTKNKDRSSGSFYGTT